MQQVVTLTGFEEKKRGTNKRGPWALRVFTAAGGSKFQTFDVDLGDKLVSLVNAPVEITYEVEKNGDFENNVVTAVKAATEDQAAAAPAPPEDPRRSKEEMRRTEALGYAIKSVQADITAVNGVSELFELAEVYVSFLANGVRSEEPVQY